MKSFERHRTCPSAGRVLTESIFNKVVESMSITGIDELVVGWQLLQILHSNSAEVARKGRVLCEDTLTSRNKAVKERSSPHP